MPVFRYAAIIAIGSLALLASRADPEGQPAGQDGWIDALSAVDPKRDALSGKWQIRDGVLLQTATNAICREIRLPVSVTGDYEVDLMFTRDSGNDSVELLFPVAGKVLRATFGGWPKGGFWSGIEKVKGQLVNSKQNPARIKGFKVIPLRKYEAGLTVRQNEDRASIALTLDGRPFVNWEGPLSDLSDAIGHGQRFGNALGLGCSKGAVRFQRVRVRSIGDGTAKHTRKTGVTNPIRHLGDRKLPVGDGAAKDPTKHKRRNSEHLKDTHKKSDAPKEDGRQPLRKWTWGAGRSAEARLLKAAGSIVVLERTDGSRITVSRSALSQEDKAYLDGR